MKVMKKVIVLYVLIFGFQLQAQFNALTYDFSGHAMVLNTNPGARTEYQSVFGIPAMSNFRFFAGNSGFSAYDLLAPDTSFNTKLEQILENLDNTDNLLINYRQDLINVVWADLDGNLYQAGMYWELDYFNNFPADLLRLAYDGNASHLYEVYDMKYLAAKAEFVQTMYFGIQKNISRELKLGYRFKLYSGLANAQSTGNGGTYYTTDGTHNYYTHHLDDINVDVKTSGYSENGDRNYYLNKFLLSGNLGWGADLGFTYHPNEKTYFTASLLDLGFIYYSKDIQTYSLRGNYQYEGVPMEFPDEGTQDYWQILKDDFEANVYEEDGDDAYVSFRPLTLYASVKFGTDNLRKVSCEDFVNPKTTYDNFVGFTGFAQLRPVKMHLGISAFYEKKWNKHLYTKFNLTADNYSYYSLGAGAVLNLGRLQVFMMVDNLAGLSDLAKSKKQAIQFGFNWIKF